MPKIQGPKGPAVPTRVSSAEKPAATPSAKPAAAEGWKAKAPAARAHSPATAAPMARGAGTIHPKLSQLNSAANVFGADSNPRATLSTEAREALPAMFARGALSTAPRAGIPTEARLSAS